MRRIAILVCSIACTSLAHAQQYGWVQVAQLGNQFTNLQAVEFVDSLHGWTAEGVSAMYRTTNGGMTWTPYDAAAGFVAASISMKDTATGWVAGSQSFDTGKIIRTSNGGQTWTLQRSVNSQVYVGSSTITPSKNIVSGYALNSPDTGKIVQTTNAGATWSELTIDDSIRQLRKMQFTDSLHGWIIYSKRNGTGGLLKTMDGGVTWSHFPAPRIFSAIHFVNSLNGWAASVGSPGSIYNTSDGGSTWTFQHCFCHPDTLLSVSAVSFTDTLNGWVFGTTVQGDFIGAIHSTTDGGWTWFREHVGLTRFINDGLMIDRQHGWAVGNGGVVLAFRPTTSVVERLDQPPKAFTLRQNYPNPFNPTTSIEYEIVQRSAARVTVYDVNGKEVRQLLNAEQEPGVYRVRFDATGLASGVYYYTMKIQNGPKILTQTKQMMLVK